LTPSPEQQAAVDALAAPVEALMGIPQISDPIREGLSTLVEAVPQIMKALDEVAKIHPFIGGASLFSDPMRNP
jgi:hypothetical protein